jgi:hypothetical protein
VPGIIARNICLAVLFIAGSDLRADEAGDSRWSVQSWTIMTSVYTRHTDPEPDHVNNQKLIGVEANFSNGWLAGASVFDNSFGQNSQFVYMGRTWAIRDSEYWFFRLRGGLLHGYKEPYEDKIPLNGLGVAPAVIPSVGFKYRRFVGELNIAGAAALMMTVGFDF